MTYDRELKCMSQWFIKSKLLFIYRYKHFKCYGSIKKGAITSTGGLEEIGEEFMKLKAWDVDPER